MPPFERGWLVVWAIYREPPAAAAGIVQNERLLGWSVMFESTNVMKGTKRARSRMSQRSLASSLRCHSVVLISSSRFCSVGGDAPSVLTPFALLCALAPPPVRKTLASRDDYRTQSPPYPQLPTPVFPSLSAHVTDRHTQSNQSVYLSSFHSNPPRIIPRAPSGPGATTTMTAAAAVAAAAAAPAPAPPPRPPRQRRAAVFSRPWPPRSPSP